MGEGVGVDHTPVATDEGTDEQQEGRLRLVEIGDELVHDMEGVTGLNHNLGFRMKDILVRSVQPIEQGLQGVGRGERSVLLIGLELGNRKSRKSKVERPSFGLKATKLETDPIERLKGAHGGGADGDDMAQPSLYMGYCGARHGDNLRMHGVLVGVGGLNGQESAGTDMERQFVGLYASTAEVRQNGFGKMQSGSRRRYRSLDARIDGLVGAFVALLSLAVEVGRNGQFADGVQYLRKRDRGIVPFEANGVGITPLRLFIGTEDEW